MLFALVERQLGDFNSLGKLKGKGIILHWTVVASYISLNNAAFSVWTVRRARGLYSTSEFLQVQDVGGSLCAGSVCVADFVAHMRCRYTRPVFPGDSW